MADKMMKITVWYYDGMDDQGRPITREVSGTYDYLSAFARLEAAKLQSNYVDSKWEDA